MFSKDGRKHIKELFDDTRGERPEMVVELEGPSILQVETEKAIKGMSRGISVGEDHVSFEMVKAAYDLVKKITDLANTIYNTGYIPEMMRE